MSCEELAIFYKSCRFSPYYWGHKMRMTIQNVRILVWNVHMFFRYQFSKFQCKISILWLYTLTQCIFDKWDKSASVNHFSFLIATHSFTNSREIREGKNRKKKEHHIESHKSIIMVSRHHTMSTSVSSVIEFPIWSDFCQNSYAKGDTMANVCNETS